jgi:hypothetical protein
LEEQVVAKLVLAHLVRQVVHKEQQELYAMGHIQVLLVVGHFQVDTKVILMLLLIQLVLAEIQE